jgi:hypothetical protein
MVEIGKNPDVPALESKSSTIKEIKVEYEAVNGTGRIQMNNFKMLLKG